MFSFDGKNKEIWITVSLVVSLLFLSVYTYLESSKRIQINEKQMILESYLEGRDAFIYGAHNAAPPLRFLDKDGIYKGVVVDYISQLSLELGVEIKTESYDWEVALQKLKDGETDFCDMFINEERAQNYVFTNPIYNLRSVLAVKEESDFSFNDINDMRIATEKGDYANTYLQKNFPRAQLIYVKNVGEGMDLLLADQADAVIGDEPIVSHFMGEKDGQLRMINTALYEESVVLGMPKKYEGLIPVLNDAIASLEKKGQLEKIQQKWFGISTPLKKPHEAQAYLRWVVLGGFLMIGLMSMISLNNYSLKKLVRIRTSELEESKDELQLIFDSMPEFILMVDQYGNIVNANKGILEFANLQLSHCVGNCCNLLLNRFGLDYEAIQPLSFGKGGNKLQIQSGKDIYEVQKYPLKELAHGMLVTLRNITLDEIHKKQLLQSSKMLAVGQLAAGMAHQIRNPLSIIRMHTYMLRENAHLDEIGKKSLAYIDDSVQKAGGIIDNVMNFWRVSGNQIEQIHLHKSFRDILNLHENLLKKKNLQSVISCPEDLSFFGNIESLKHILVNLVSNAIDAMSENGTLTLIGERKDDQVVIGCQDTGVGIASENLENLFNPFFTTKELGKGTGLGLFVVYSEVEKLEGKIKVESKVGEGTCFTIFLPYREA